MQSLRPLLCTRHLLVAVTTPVGCYACAVPAPAVTACVLAMAPALLYTTPVGGYNFVLIVTILAACVLPVAPESVTVMSS